MKKTRHFYIKAIATPEFKKHYEENWQKIIKKTINKTSMILKKEFGINIVLKKIQMKNYKPKSFAYYYFWDYLNAFKKELLSTEYDAIIIFTNTPFLYVGDECYVLAVAGYSNRNVSTYRDYVILTNPEKTKIYYKSYQTVNWRFLKNLLLHEIGHLFNAQHVKDKKSFMNNLVNSRSCFFNKANEKRILKNKWKKFR